MGQRGQENRRIKLACWVPVETQYAWIATTVADIETNFPDAELDVYLLTNQGINLKPIFRLLYFLQHKLDTLRSIDEDTDPCHSVSFERIMPFKLFSLPCKTEANLISCYSCDVESIRSKEYDVIIYFGRYTLDQQLMSVSQLGVWAFQFGRDNSHMSASAFWSVYNRDTVLRSALIQLSANGRGRILYETHSMINPCSVVQSERFALWKMAHFPVRAMKEICFSNKNYSSDDQTQVCRKKVGLTTLAIMCYKQCCRMLIRKMNGVMRGPWEVGVLDKIQATSTLISVPLRNGMVYHADPFIVKGNGCYYLFMEELDRKTLRGHLTASKVTNRGKIYDARKVLSSDSHLSYPNIFMLDSRYYMIPESAEEGAITLYKAVSFPYKWEPVVVLLSGISCMDTNILYHGNQYWLITTIKLCKGFPAWDELHIFYSDTLESGDWTPHPNNPVISDVRRGRNGGAMILKDNKYYRVAQSSAVEYGQGLALYEITRLDERGYEEVYCSDISGPLSAQFGITNIHTYNEVDDICVIDFKKNRLKCLFDNFRRVLR